MEFTPIDGPVSPNVLQWLDQLIRRPALRDFPMIVQPFRDAVSFLRGDFAIIQDRITEQNKISLVVRHIPIRSCSLGKLRFQNKSAKHNAVAADALCRRQWLRLPRAYQTSLRKTSSIVESSAFSLKGLMSTVAFTRLKKNSMAGLFRWPVKKMNRLAVAGRVRVTAQ